MIKNEKHPNLSDLKNKALNLKHKGYSVSETSEKLNIPKSTVWDWFNDRRRTNTCMSVKTYPTKTHDNVSKFDKNFDICDFLSQLAPIKVQNFKLNSKNNYTHTNNIMILNDLHFPMQCKSSIDIFLSVVSELQPKSIIINGDSLDMLAISRYPKDIRTKFNLLEERVEYHKFLSDLLSVSNGAEIVEIHGNHSGDSTFGRWWRYLSERIGELSCLPEIKDTLSYENVFLGEYKKFVKMADYVELTDDLVVLHGEVVRKYGGYSARGTLEKYYQSSIMGHTHRVGYTAQRIPSIGKRKDKQIYAWEMGCMCDLNPLYGSAPNWQNAFGIVALSEDGTFGLETVMINDSKATVSTLQKTFYA